MTWRFRMMVLLCSIGCFGYPSQSPRPTPFDIQNEKPRQQHKRQDHVTCQTANCGDSFIVIQNSYPVTTTEAGGSVFKSGDKKELTDWATVVNMLFTAVLAFVGCLQVWLFRRQTNLQQQQNEFSYKSFVVTQRPRLIIRNIVVQNEGEFLSFLRAPKGTLRIVNIGNSIAFITSCKSKVVIGAPNVDALPPQPAVPSDEAVDLKLQSGMFMTQEFTASEDDDFVLQGHGAMFQEPGEEPTVYVTGQIVYRDELRNVRVTQFFRVFDWRRKRFLPLDNPDYENAD